MMDNKEKKRDQSRQEKIDRINELGRELDAAKKTGGDITELHEDIFLLMDELLRGKEPEYDVRNRVLLEMGGHGEKVSNRERRAALGRFFDKKLPLFDANQSDLYPFMFTQLNFCAIDERHEALDEHRIEKPDEETGEKKTAWVNINVSLDADNEDDVPPADKLPNQKARIDKNLLFNETALQILTLQLHVRENLTGRADNEKKILYYRLFFTDMVTNICHSVETPDEYARHERDVFEAMRLRFLDFFMERECRTLPAICACRVKAHGEMVEGQPMEEAVLPLPNDVYRTYLNRYEGIAVRSDGAISNQRSAYQSFLRGSIARADAAD